MERLRDEEFRINEPRTAQQPNVLSAVVMGLGGNSKLYELKEHQQAFVAKKLAQRKQNIRANRDAMDGIISNPTVQNLYTLGEIKWYEAIALDHFTTLDVENQEEIIGMVEHDIDSLLDKYHKTNACMSMMLATFDTANIMAVTALQNAQTMNLAKSKVADMDKEELWDVLANNYITHKQKFDKCFDSMSQLVCGDDCGLDKANDLRKQTARDLVSAAHYADMCCLLVHSSAISHFRSVLGMVKHGSLSRDSINHIDDCKLKYDMRLYDDVAEMSSGRERSDLIIIDDTAEPERR